MFNHIKMICNRILDWIFGYEEPPPEKPSISQVIAEQQIAIDKAVYTAIDNPKEPAKKPRKHTKRPKKSRAPKKKPTRTKKSKKR